MTTARAKGLTERQITFRHVLRNALLPVVTMAGVQVGALLGGSVVVESVFAWPGLGQLAFEALFSRDFNLLLGIFFISACLVVFVNIVVDVIYVLLDPAHQGGRVNTFRQRFFGNPRVVAGLAWLGLVVLVAAVAPLIAAAPSVRDRRPAVFSYLRWSTRSAPIPLDAASGRDIVHGGANSR